MGARKHAKIMEMVKKGRKLEQSLMSNRQTVAMNAVTLGGKVNLQSAGLSLFFGNVSRIQEPEKVKWKPPEKKQKKDKEEKKREKEEKKAKKKEKKEEKKAKKKADK